MMKYQHRALLLAALVTAIVVSTLGYDTSKAQDTGRTFPETGKSVNGRFLQYWDTHGGLAQQGYPISNELGEVSVVDGKVYTVQYFERAVFELHRENPAPNDVLLSLLGSFRYQQKYPGGAPGQTPNTSAGAKQFTETGKSLGGVFLDYWNTHGALAQQGFPISDEFQEKSDLDGKTYTVQYFERAVFELHPENPAASGVLLSQLGTFQYQQKSTTNGWIAPPYPVPAALVGSAPATPTPVRSQPAPPEPTKAPAPAPPPTSSGKVVISNIYYDGQEPRSEGDEYVAVKNVGSTNVDLAGYRINAGDNGQNFTFPSFVLKAGAEVRVYTNRDIPGSFSFHRRSAIWNNKGDCGYLYDPQGNEVSNYCY